DAAMRDATRQATENDLPGIARTAALTGNLGSSKRGIAEGLVTRGLLDKAADVSSNLRGQAYSQGLGLAEQGREFNNNAMLDALTRSCSLGSDTANLGLGLLSSSGNYANLGLNARGMSSDLNNTALGQWSGLYGAASDATNAQLQAPWDRLANYYSIIGNK